MYNKQRSTTFNLGYPIPLSKNNYWHNVLHSADFDLYMSSNVQNFQALAEILNLTSIILVGISLGPQSTPVF